MKHLVSTILAVLLFVCMASQALAHFGMIIPSDTMVMQADDRTVRLTFSFSHPFEGIGMHLAKPKACAVMANQDPQDLLPALEPARVMEHEAWQIDFPVRRPGVYMFFMEPQPYWEPAEDTYIIHYTKTVLTAFGDDEGWDREIGLKTEIVPLAKPYGLYAGNVFQGIVKVDGKPVPHSEVEIEFYNQGPAITAPTDYMITQVVKADANGVFIYAAPKAGWWGFAALNTADFTLPRDGEPKEVEIGAVLWVLFHDMP